MDELAKLITDLIDRNAKLLNENAQLRAELAELRPTSIDTIPSTRERQKLETSWCNIDEQAAKNKAIEQRYRLAYLLRQGAKPPEPKPAKNRGRPTKPVEFDWANLPKLVEIIKEKSNYKTDLEAITEILQDVSIRRRCTEIRKLQVRLSKSRAKQKTANRLKKIENPVS